MQDALRRRPLEKRHTKPCRFYQTMSCPLPPDVCDFAHVLENPISRLKVNDTCRFYKFGYCANGSRCRFTHSVEASPALSDVSQISTTDGQRTIFLSTSELRPPPSGVEQRSPTIYIRPPSAVNNGAPSPNLPAFANIPISPSSPPLAKMYLNASYPTLPSPTAYSDFDDFVICTENPQMSEHSHTHQSRIYIADVVSPIHVSPFPTSPPVRRSSFGPLSPGYKVQSPLFMVEPNFVPVLRPVKKRRSRGVSKKKLAKYKTKPCKFFFANGACPNGNNCTFIHSEDAETLRTIHLTRSADKRASAFENSGEIVSHQQDASDGGDNRWTNQEDDQTSSSQTSSVCSSGSPTPLLSPRLVLSGTGGRIINGRPRANSIPSTPSATSQVSMESLFPAESPAIL